MLALKIQDVKGFMINLLIKPMFDPLLVSEVAIATCHTVHISGSLNKDFYSEEEWEKLGSRKNAEWSEMKPFAYQLMKGQKTPLGFKIVLLLPSTYVEKILMDKQIELTPEDINGLFLNIKYEKNELYLTTGTSLKIFTMDKTLEREWEEWVKRFLVQYEIAYE